MGWCLGSGQLLTSTLLHNRHHWLFVDSQKGTILSGLQFSVQLSLFLCFNIRLALPEVQPSSAPLPFCFLVSNLSDEPVCSYASWLLYVNGFVLDLGQSSPITERECVIWAYISFFKRGL